MCALSYFLEREGLITTGISLVRENTASMKPPRALWVSFPGSIYTLQLLAADGCEAATTPVFDACSAH